MSGSCCEEILPYFLFLPKKAVLAKASIQLEKKFCRKMAVTCLTLTASLPVTVIPLLLHTRIHKYWSQSFDDSSALCLSFDK